MTNVNVCSYFHKGAAFKVHFFLQFIPEMMFLVAMFGYMDLLIFVKWFKYGPESSADAPSILIG